MRADLGELIWTVLRRKPFVSYCRTPFYLLSCLQMLPRYINGGGQLQ